MSPDVERLLDLAAQTPPEQRAAFLDRECPDPAVRGEVAELLRYASEAESSFDRAIQITARSLRTAQEPAAGDTIGGYRVLAQIGRGGMGSVYLAERTDGEIQQKVAVKLLRADTHYSGWRERFLRERQMLASLHHPSVVHVIDAGHTDDGRPFLVMEHVEGEPIDHYAARIGVRERLKLLASVCEGVAHAHRHLIIHRDLKPSNILVDAAGRPKLLDFGIAKPLNETGDVTQPMERLLTPNYASPEQLRGEAQSTATDIYSLGAVLYKLLTGVAPRENNGRGPDQQPVPPSRVNPDVPKDVDFVVAKAMRPEPEERYGSVDEFAADIRAVLAWRPVQARGGDVWYRTRRHLRRYWIPLSAAVMVTASLAAGLMIANRQRAIAERRFADVRQLAGKLFDIDVQVAQLPGGSKTRQLIVDTALEYLQRVTANVHMQPDLALELGAAYMRVGRVQGVNISPNLGQTEKADQTEQKAQALIDSVLTAQPRNRAALLRAAQVAHDRMILAADGHHNDDALRFAQTCLERLDRYLKTGTLNASSDRLEAQQVIIALINVANRYMNADRFDESLQVSARAIEIARQTNWPTQAAAALMVVALAHRGKGELDEALSAARESARVLNPGDGDKSTGRWQTYGLALIREGQILGEDKAISLNRPEEALACFEHARKIGEDFAQRDSGDYQSQYRVFLAESKIAAIVRHAAPARALVLYDDGLRRLSGARDNSGTLRNEVLTLAASIDPLLRLGRRDDARNRLESAFRLLRRSDQYPALQIELGSAADLTLRAQAEFEISGGNLTRGAALYEELLRLVAGSNPKPETRLQDAMELSNIHQAAAAAYRRAGRMDVAGFHARRRLDLWTGWNGRLPNNTFVLRQLDEARRDSSPQQTRLPSRRPTFA